MGCEMGWRIQHRKKDSCTAILSKPPATPCGCWRKVPAVSFLVSLDPTPSPPCVPPVSDVELKVGKCLLIGSFHLSFVEGTAVWLPGREASSLQKCLHQDLKSKLPSKDAGWRPIGCLSGCYGNTWQSPFRKEGSLGLAI